MPRVVLVPVSLSSLSLREGDGVRLECGEILFMCPPLSPLHITSHVTGVEPFMDPTSSCNWHPWLGGMACAISASAEASEASKCTPLIGKLYTLDLETTCVTVAGSATEETLAICSLDIAISDAVASFAPSMTPGLHGASARASSSSRCFFLRIAKSFNDILTLVLEGEALETQVEATALEEGPGLPRLLEQPEKGVRVK